MRTCRSRPAVPRSAFAGFRFPPGAIVLAVRWYLRSGLSDRDGEELLAGRGIEVGHVTVFGWVQRFTPLLADAARPCRRAVGDRWFVDETSVKVAKGWRYVDQAIDQFGQVIGVFASQAGTPEPPGGASSRRSARQASRPPRSPPIGAGVPGGVEELLPAAWHRTDRYANNRSRPTTAG